MSFWSKNDGDGKRVLRSSSRIAGVAREPSVARNPEDQQESIPVARNPDNQQQCPQQTLISDYQKNNTETSLAAAAISPSRDTQVRSEEISLQNQMSTTTSNINSRLAAMASNDQQVRSETENTGVVVQETAVNQNVNVLQAEAVPREYESEEIGMEEIENITEVECNTETSSTYDNLVEMYNRNESEMNPTKTGNYGFRSRIRTDYIPLRDEDFSADPVFDDNEMMSNNRFRGGGFAGVPYPAPRLRYWKPGAAAEAASQLPGMKKRRLPWKERGGGKRQRLGPAMPKTASQIVNERSPGLQYKFSDMIGQPHDPLFHVTVVFPPTGLEYTGSGKSKKMAKNNVAERILADLNIPIPERETEEESPAAKMEVVEEASVAAPPPPVLISTNLEPMATPLPLPPGPNFAQTLTDPMAYADIDFASDDVLDIVPQSIPVEVVPSGAANFIKRIINIPNLRDNAAAALNLISKNGSPVYNVISEEGPPHEKVFTTELNYLDQNKIQQTFVGKGCSKKKSKLEAATQALISILGPQLFLDLADRSLNLATMKSKSNGQFINYNAQTALDVDEPASQENFDPLNDQYNLAFANHIRDLIVEKYDEIMTDDQAHLPQKVLAGVVMTRGFPLIENCSVIAVTTGTKCIEGDHMSDEGLALNDCHAEILATRCLRDFIYSQLEEICFEGVEAIEEGCIFEVVQDGEEGIEKFRLRDDVNFHLYISTSPCGDARIFSPKGLELESLECEESEIEPPGDELPAAHSNRSNRGVLRAKIEAGEGTIAVANLNKGPQTWDAILQGQALYTMSCSDKVCRWNVVGAQGALLSNLLDPIYYSSIVLGSLHHPIHFERAVFGRVENLNEELALPYKVNKPRLLMVSNDAKRQVKKSPNHAIVWTCGWSTHEVLHASKGRCWSPEIASRLSKRMQFLRFLKIYKNRTGRRDNFADIHYADAKALATDYKKARSQLMENFRSNGFGSWITKPFEQDAFKIGK